MAYLITGCSDIQVHFGLSRAAGYLGAQMRMWRLYSSTQGGVLVHNRGCRLHRFLGEESRGCFMQYNGRDAILAAACGRLVHVGRQLVGELIILHFKQRGLLGAAGDIHRLGDVVRDSWKLADACTSGRCEEMLF